MTHQRVTEFRIAAISGLRELLQQTLLDPDAEPLPPKAMWGMLAAYETLVVATSDSNPGFVFTDLPPSERTAYRAAKHLLGVLDAAASKRAT